MSRFLIVPVAVVCLALLWFWWSGGFDRLAFWAAVEQREFQNQMARALRAVRAGKPEALSVLLMACFAYGFVHAVGPGHGKVLIGGYGVGRQVALRRLTLISLFASLGQAVTAVVLVYLGVLVFELSRTQMVETTERVMAPVSYAAIVLVGLWLLFRGLRRFWRLRRSATGTEAAHHHHDHHHHDHDHHHHAGEVCSECGHKHGPTPEEAAQAGTVKEALALIAGIALRPCTGALFVLILTWQMGIAWAGVGGAFAMALGTATVTILVGWGAFGIRNGMLASVAGSPRLAILGPVIEVAAGMAVVLLASGLLLRAI